MLRHGLQHAWKEGGERAGPALQRVLSPLTCDLNLNGLG